VNAETLLPPSCQQVKESALRLPCSPALLPRLIAIISEPESSAEEIAQLIMVDASLAAATLRLANSAFFSVGEPTSTVAEAVVRLGQRELFRLAALALVSRWEEGTGGRPVHRAGRGSPRRIERESGSAGGLHGGAGV